MSAACGIVLAAGAGTRYGMPKALALTTDGTPWVRRAVAALATVGCDPVIVVLGARSDEARALVPPTAQIVIAENWALGVSATLRTALDAAERTTADAALIVPVDTPAMPASVCTRVLEAGGGGPHALARAVHGRMPGHPVLIGRAHWAAAAADSAGDRGAGPYLRAHGATAVPCDDLWDGADIDTR